MTVVIDLSGSWITRIYEYMSAIIITMEDNLNDQSAKVYEFQYFTPQKSFNSITNFGDNLVYSYTSFISNIKNFHV